MENRDIDKDYIYTKKSTDNNKTIVKLYTQILMYLLKR